MGAAINRRAREVLMRLFPSLCALALAACTAEWNSAPPGIDLTGDPPPLSSFKKLNAMPAGVATRMEALDGSQWTVFCEFRTASERLSGGGCKQERVVRLGAPVAGAPNEEIHVADSFIVRLRALYITHIGTSGRTMWLHRPGDGAADDVSFILPDGRPLIYINDGGDDDVFVYWLLDKSTTHFDVFRRDQKYQRHFPIPAGVDPSDPGHSSGFDFLLTSDGSILVIRNPDGSTTANSTLDESTISLGTRPAVFLIDNMRAALLTLGSDGFRSVPLLGGRERVLTSTVFDPATLQLDDYNAYYVLGGDLFRVPLDGSAPPAMVQANAARLIGLGTHGEIAYSHDPIDRYIGGAGDGWIGDWNFMERGRFPRFSADGTRVRFLEHAAITGIVGELTSVMLPAAGGGAPVSLGINVHAFRELPDGRVLSIENHAQAGVWNRLVVIDEAAHTKHWVVPSAAEFFVVPDGSQIVADVVSGASGYNIVNLPSPSR
jgi:hypothetical protein